MRLLYTILPLLSAVTLAQDLVGEECQCPQVKCSTDDLVALCNCFNGREKLCVTRCPNYLPTYLPCPHPAPTPKPSPSRSPLPVPTATSKPVTCECLQINCIQVWPQSCLCANAAKQRCFDDCGGLKPAMMDCGDGSLASRASTPEPEIIARAPEPEPAAEAPCECEEIFCVQMWPESCYCANAAAEKCAKTCGRKASLQECPPQPSLTLATLTKTKAAKPTKYIKSTKSKSLKPSATSLPPNPHPLCGGGRANYLSCEPGFMCITDPYTPGCGPACDALGICVRDEMCGGFGGFACKGRGEVCHDDARDGCDPNDGGADCGGVCVVPHAKIGGDGL